jgi:hypothetical protein
VEKMMEPAAEPIVGGPGSYPPPAMIAPPSPIIAPPKPMIDYRQPPPTKKTMMKPKMPVPADDEPLLGGKGSLPPRFEEPLA